MSKFFRKYVKLKSFFNGKEMRRRYSPCLPAIFYICEVGILGNGETNIW